MNIGAKVILDSISQQGVRLTTMEVTMHRFVLAEFNTHRAFSRNSASSRAIPVRKTLERYKEQPAFPASYTTEKPGMSGGAVLTGESLVAALDLFEDIHMFTGRMISEYLTRCEEKNYTPLHKSLINRLMEPMQWHTVIVTATEWDNFFAQRCHEAAQPEMRLVAENMQRAYNLSAPVRKDIHTPYIRPDDDDELTLLQQVMVSAARCARVSYLTHDGVRNPKADLDLYNKLSGANPPHWSPMEHVAFDPAFLNTSGLIYYTGNRNFEDWVQLRQVLDEGWEYLLEQLEDEK